MKKAILCIAVAAISINWAYAGNLALKKNANQPSIEFYKEEITLGVTNGKAAICGIYYFRNNTDKDGEFPVLFPFYVDSLSLFPYSIKPYIIDSNKVIELNFQAIKKANCISIAIPLKARSITKWHLDYCQIINASEARYIITSTNAWHNPLKEAIYRFVIPSEYDSIYTWPAADTSYKEGANTVLLSHQVDFLPQKDMKISWTEK